MFSVLHGRGRTCAGAAAVRWGAHQWVGCRGCSRQLGRRRRCSPLGSRKHSIALQCSKGHGHDASMSPSCAPSAHHARTSCLHCSYRPLGTCLQVLLQLQEQVRAVWVLGAWIPLQGQLGQNHVVVPVHQQHSHSVIVNQPAQLHAGEPQKCPTAAALTSGTRQGRPIPPGL